MSYKEIQKHFEEFFRKFKTKLKLVSIIYR